MKRQLSQPKFRWRKRVQNNGEDKASPQSSGVSSESESPQFTAFPSANESIHSRASEAGSAEGKMMSGCAKSYTGMRKRRRIIRKFRRAGKLLKRNLKPRRTPLHRMCTTGILNYSESAISAYLTSNPGDALAVDQRGMTPLHTILSHLPHRDDIAALLIEAAPRACEMRDRYGFTPLHIAAGNARSVSCETLSLLLRCNPSAALSADRNGETPFGLYCKVLEETAKQAHEAELRRQRMCPNRDHVLIVGKVLITYGPLLDKCVPLVRTVACGEPTVPEDPEKRWDTMLHDTLYAVKRATSTISTIERDVVSALTSADTRKYKFLLRAVMRWTHKQASDKDGRGNLPLHIAASILHLNEPPAPESSERLVPAPLSEDETEGIIDVLARLNPEAANSPNLAGLLPFDIADKNGSIWSSGGVKAMVNANVNVLIGLEVSEGVLPILLSKVGRDLEIGAMFQMLRERPEALLHVTGTID